jgi:hypothetical protein
MMLAAKAFRDGAHAQKQAQLAARWRGGFRLAPHDGDLVNEDGELENAGEDEDEDGEFHAAVADFAALEGR